MLDYVVEFSRLGFEPVVREFAALIDITQITSLVNAAFISQTKKEAFIKLIKRRFNELELGLKNHG